MPEIPTVGIENAETIGRQAIIIKTPIQVTVPSDVNANHTTFDREFFEVATSQMDDFAQPENGAMMGL